MSGNAFIFLNRNIEQDKRVIENMLRYYKDMKMNYQILLFPEGTDRGERAIKISHTYADTNGLPRYDYVLHPRTTGFNLFLNQMRKSESKISCGCALGRYLDNYITTVYDVSIAYPQHIVESEIELVKGGRFPESVHFDIKRYDVNEICGNEADKPVDASKWLVNLWKAKEARLKKFYMGNEGDQRRFQPSGEAFVWPVKISMQLNLWCSDIPLRTGLFHLLLSLDRSVGYVGVDDFCQFLCAALCSG